MNHKIIKNTIRPKAKPPTKEKEHLQNYRVVQKDLVYVIGIPKNIADEKTLERYEYFGQYGKIKKIVVNNSCPFNNDSASATVSAFVTFNDIEDARECIFSLENFEYQGYSIKASLGTSKYCTSFLSDTPCTNSQCMYLHSFGSDADSFNTTDITTNNRRFVSITRPSRPSDYNRCKFKDDRETEFPPRRILNQERLPEEEDEEEEFAEEDEEEGDFSYCEEASLPEMESLDVSNFVRSVVKNVPVFYEPMVPQYKCGESLESLLPDIRKSWLRENRMLARNKE